MLPLEVQKLPLPGPVTSSPVWFRDSGRLLLAFGGPDLRVADRRGKLLDGWPRRGKRAFASSPSVGDLDGDGHPEIVVGCDDHTVQAFHLDGSKVGGWPLRTGRDVFSTPALGDVDGDGSLEVVFGSDDGNVYAVRGDGRPLPGWPRDLGAFVSASPALADLDGDGRPEIIIGGWDRKVHAFDARGRESDGWPFHVPTIVWSSVAPLAAGGDWYLAFCADALYVLDARGTLVPGWPQQFPSWTPSTPAWTIHEGRPVLLAAGDRSYAFDLGGNLLSGWPRTLEGFGWPSPVDVRVAQRASGLFGSWGGIIEQKHLEDQSDDDNWSLITEGRISATPALASDEDHTILAAASWDSHLYIATIPGSIGPGLTPMFRVSAGRDGSVSVTGGFDIPDPAPSSRPAGSPVVSGAESRETPRGDSPWEVRVTGTDLGKAAHLMVEYRILLEGEWHPSPVVLHRGERLALVQPLRPGHVIDYRVVWESYAGERGRWPARGSRRVVVLPELVADAADRLGLRRRRPPRPANG